MPLAFEDDPFVLPPEEAQFAARNFVDLDAGLSAKGGGLKFLAEDWFLDAGLTDRGALDLHESSGLLRHQTDDFS